MIELERHIEILLLSNDCVIVPELGGFMAHHIDACYDESEELFLPPLRTLGFNPQLRLNDHLLVQSYIETYDISYPEALRRIEAEVAELKQHLANEGEYELFDIGTLRLNSEGHMEFEPCEAGILTPELYGLSSVEISSLPTTENELWHKKDSLRKPLEHKEKEEPQQELTETELPEEHAITIKMSWLRNVAAVAAAIVAFFMLSTPVYESGNDLQQSAVIPVVQNEKKLDVTAEEAFLPTAMPAQSKTNTTAEVANVPSVPEYVIVLASQTTRNHATTFTSILQKSGFNDVSIREMKDKKVRVVYGHFTSEEEAYNKLRSLRNNEYFSNGWVLQIKK